MNLREFPRALSREPSIVGRLERVLIFAMMFAGLISMLFIVSEEVIDRREALRKQSSSWLQMMAVQLGGPVLFQDKNSAGEIMRVSFGFPDLEALAIVLPDEQGRPAQIFTALEQAGDPPIRMRAGEVDANAGSSRLLLSAPIVFTGREMGWLYARFDLTPLYNKLGLFALTLTIILGVSGALAVVFARRLLRKAVQPIQELSDAAEQVSHEHRYSLRVPSKANDEVGRLTRRFNDMLAQIELREDVLAQQRDQLALLREKADEANAAKSGFLASMSHEIRTPLNAVIGMTYLALQTALTPKQRDYVSKAMQAGEHLLALINDVLDFSKLEAGKVELETVDVNIRQLLHKLDALVGERAREKGLSFEVDIADDVPLSVLGDEVRLSQILINLAGNAVKFTQHGQITVRVLRAGGLQQADGAGFDVLRFEVIDTGIGLSKEQQERLFSSFQQADSSVTRRYGGTGLGLVICQQLSKLMGGSVGVNSAPGQGSCFWFTARLRPNQFVGFEPPARDVLMAPIDLHGLRVLLVEDHPDNQQLASELLTLAGASVVLAENGQTALDLLQQYPIDVVLMDIMMPVLDGFATTRQIRANPLWVDLPVIAMTANVTSEACQQALAVGMNGFVSKPIQPARLYDCLQSYVRLPSPVQDKLLTPQADSPLQGVRILLVDDEPMNQMIGQEILQMAGAKVDVVADGQAAIDQLALMHAEAQDYDCVLMDIHMPVLDGLVATAQIRQNAACQDLLIVAMTASDSLEDRQCCHIAGMNAFLSKPVAPDQLAGLIAEHVRPAA